MERNQTYTKIYTVYTVCHLYDIPNQGKLIYGDKEYGWEKGVGIDQKEEWGNFLRWQKIFILFWVNGVVAQVYIILKIHWPEHLRLGHCIAGKLYLNLKNAKEFFQI